MLTPRGYGFGARSSMGYYYFGRAANQAKFLQAGAVVEAGWLSGFGTAPPGSNLPNDREIGAYSIVGIGRFASFGPGQVLVGILGKNRVAYPTPSTLTGADWRAFIGTGNLWT